VTLTVGLGVTFTVNVFGVPVQLPLLPLTVYTVVEDGVKVLVLPEPDGIHVYVDAPVTLATTAVPLQIVVFVIDVAILGVAVTLMVIVLEELQVPLNPLTVYEVVPEGLTVITVVVWAPGAQE
jgi:hypothetical protein